MLALPIVIVVVVVVVVVAAAVVVIIPHPPCGVVRFETQPLLLARPLPGLLAHL